MRARLPTDQPNVERRGVHQNDLIYCGRSFTKSRTAGETGKCGCCCNVGGFGGCTCLRLYARHPVENEDRPVQHSGASLHLKPKIHVPWRVDDVDPSPAPLHRDGSALNGDPALPLLWHEVGHRVPRIYGALLVSVLAFGDGVGFVVRWGRQTCGGVSNSSSGGVYLGSLEKSNKVHTHEQTWVCT